MAHFLQFTNDTPTNTQSNKNTIEMDKKTTPVLLLTGYLGSGKTTLLNRILGNTKGLKFAVIVNDIGEVNIDETLIEQGGVVDKADDSLVPLSNGCICCTLKMDLVQQLSDIVSQQRFDYIVIEASGICEPAPIAQTISVYPTMYPNLAEKGKASVDAIVTVCDALRLRDEFGEGKELQRTDLDEDDLASLVIEQVEFCNVILLNKASEVTPEELGRIRAILHEIQPKAEIIPCDYGDVDFDKILNTHLFDFNKVATSARWIEAVEADEDDLENEEEGEALEYGISTFVYYRRRPFNLADFDDFAARLLPKSVVRCKGLCYFEDERDTCYVFEQSGKQVSIRNAGKWYATMPEKELKEFMKRNPDAARLWDDEYGDRMQKLVFIGQNMDREAIERDLDRCLR